MSVSYQCQPPLPPELHCLEQRFICYIPLHRTVFDYCHYRQLQDLKMLQFMLGYPYVHLCAAFAYLLSVLVHCTAA